MNIRTKLLLLLVLVGTVLLANLVAVGNLARTVMTAFNTVEEVVAPQQIVTARMQARLRDAEAALYRYMIEGEPGFASQFNHQLQNFQSDVETYRTLATSPEERSWATELATAHDEAVELGTALMELSDEQQTRLDRLEAMQAELASILAGPLRVARTEDSAYQKAISGMETNQREMFLAVTAYLTSPRESERVRFTEAAVGFHHHYARYHASLPGGPEQGRADAVRQHFAEMEQLGSRLISGRDRQQAQFARFAAILFRAGQRVLVGQIQPQTTEKLAAAREELSAALRAGILASVAGALLVSATAGAITLPLLRRMRSGITALLYGADRVAAGRFDQPVEVNGRDELNRLAGGFNTMMGELGMRERRLRARLSELEALRKVALQLTSTLELGDVLGTIAGSARRLVDATEVRIFMSDAANTNTPTFAAIAQRDAHPSAGPREVRPDGLVATVARTGDRQVIDRAAEHPLFHSPEARAWGIRAAAGFPLKLGDRMLGVFNVSLNDRDRFREDELRILSLLADQAAVALENARLYQSVAEKEARLQTLAEKLVNVQEEERRLVGLDLHDGLTQLLLSASMHLDTFASLQDGLAESARSELLQSRARIQEAIEEARRVVSEMRPSALEDFGFLNGLRQYVMERAREQGWEVEFEVEVTTETLPGDIEIALFRIAQEAISNSCKYAGTDRVRVALQEQDGTFTLEVRDWGCGFDPAALANESDRLGLVGMRERTALLGGHCTIDSAPGAGTGILVSVPLNRTTSPMSSP